MFNKKIIMLIVVIACTMLYSCASKPRRGTDTDIIEHQRKIDELESTIRSYEATIGVTIRTLEDLNSRARDMETTVDGVIELFGQYQQLVEQLIRNYNTLRKEIGEAEVTINYFIYSNNATYVNSSAWLYTNAKKSDSATLAGYTIIEGIYDRRKKYGRIKKCTTC